MNKLRNLCLLYALVLPIGFSCQKSTPAAVSPAPVTGQTGPKQPIHGLVTMGKINNTNPGFVPDNSLAEANAHPNVYRAVVIIAQWKQLEPQRGQFELTAIEQGLTAIRQYNKTYPDHPVTGKLRILMGLSAPDWAKNLGGDPVQVVDESTTPATTVQVGRFWTAAYRQAWQELQQALAHQYDTDPLVQEVAITSCSTITGEPFVAPLNQTTIAALHQAGFTDAQYKAALLGAIDDYAAWQNTALDYTFNPFRNSDSGRPVVDSSFTTQVVQTFRTRLGSRAVVANHGLDNPVKDQPLYDLFRTLGPPLEFQTLSPGVNWPTVIPYGLTYHPTEIEIWDTKAAGGFADVSLAQLQAWAQAIGQ